ncbi:GNAT family N-acetyltransferase [Chitinophagaceae bacterium 26-R-25]|nr:GNAT family N-acetyltransferase [Chitinophagaceae bacterium 26-R-25]
MVSLSDKHNFFTLIKDFEYVPYTQTEGWYKYNSFSKPEDVVFIVDNIEEPSIACFGYIKKFFGLRMLMIEGECLKKNTVSREMVQSFFEDITKLGYDFVEISSISIYNPEYEIGIRSAGYLKPVGTFSMHLSKVIDLKKEISFSGNWRRNLKKSEKLHLQFEVIENASEKDITTFLELYTKLLSDKKIHHNIAPDQLKYLLADSRFKLAVAKDGNDKTDAVFIFFTDKTNAVSLFTAKSEEAKDNGAMFFIYAKLLEHLQQTAHSYFDVGRLTPSMTKELNGVFDFKDGMKGDYVIYNDEWSWYKKSRYRTMIYFVKKFLMKKREA